MPMPTLDDQYGLRRPPLAQLHQGVRLVPNLFSKRVSHVFGSSNPHFNINFHPAIFQALGIHMRFLNL